MSIRVVADSTCDLPGSVVTELGIVVVPMYINIGQRSLLDGVELSRQEFYAGLGHFEQHPTTSAPGIGTFAELYERLAAQGASEILSVHVSASLSNTVNVARLAAEATGALPVTVFDSGQLTLGTGFLVIEAARAAAEGQSMPGIVARLEDKAARTHSFAALDTLEYLRRSGRLTRLQSGLGTLLSVKPLLRMHAGELTMERVRTRRRVVERLIDLVSALGRLEQLALVHTHAPERAEALRRRALHLFPDGVSSLSEEVTPVIGSHVGPGAVGLVGVQAKS